MPQNKSGCRACGTTRSSRFRAYVPVVHEVLFKEKGPVKPSSMMVCNACYALCVAAASTSIHEVSPHKYCHNYYSNMLYYCCWFQLVLTLLCIFRQLRLMRQPRKVPTRKRSQARTSHPVILAMKRIFLRFRRRLTLRRQDVDDFAATSASFAGLAHRVNFIITVIKEDFYEYLSSFLYQALL
jgi:hypothetical protein